MKLDERKPEFYLDWVYRILAEECAKKNYLFSEGGKAAFRKLWWRQCESFTTDRSGVEEFKRSKAIMHHKLVGIGKLTAIAPTFSRSMSIGANEVIRGYKAFMALDSPATPKCPTIEDVQVAEQLT